jgi:signal transduction histidine kinase
MRDIIWFINPNNDFGEDMINKMKETAAKLLAGIKWSFQSDPDVKLDEFNLENRRNIYLIYKEALNNIIRHSNSSTCSIELTRTASSLLLKVKDEGSGFDEKSTIENNGLRSMKRRAGNMNGKINIKTEVGKGTTVILSIPISGQKFSITK